MPERRSAAQDPDLMAELDCVKEFHSTIESHPNDDRELKMYQDMSKKTQSRISLFGGFVFVLVLLAIIFPFIVILWKWALGL